MMKRLLTAAAIALLPVPAGAADAPAVPDWFRAIDRDRDGTITINEMHSARYLRFARADAYRDGLLTPKELRTDRPWLQRFAWGAVNRDGRISIGECEAKGHARFVALDLNGDGRLSLREIMVMKNAQQTGKATSG